jgi:hypothetical protein
MFIFKLDSIFKRFYRRGRIQDLNLCTLCLVFLLKILHCLYDADLKESGFLQVKVLVQVHHLTHQWVYKQAWFKNLA